MELKPGYKQTEVGVIPQEWNDGEIGDLKPFVTSGSRGWAEFYSDRGSPFIRITNMSRESIYLDLSDLRLVNLPSGEHEGTRTEVHTNDVLVSITADIGIIGYVGDSVPKPAYINQHIALIRFDPAKADSRFVSYFLASENSQKHFRGTTDVGAKAGMSLGTVRKIKLALPPPPEQRAIAEALSDVDALIGALDQLIAKKRDLKQAAMQQLLSGQQRLPGFHGEWGAVTLGDLLVQKATYGIVTAGEFKSAGVPMVRGGDIKGGRIEGDLPMVSVEKSREYSRTILKRDDVVIALVGYPGEAAKVLPTLEGANISRAVGLLRLNERVFPDYLASYLNSSIGRKMVLAPSAGSAQVVVNLADLNRLRFNLPTIAEQTAIAAVLSDMDAEIAALEARRDKTRALKQGMMQELLTGRIRLL